MGRASGTTTALVVGASIIATFTALWGANKYIEHSGEVEEELAAIRNPRPGQRLGKFYCERCHKKWFTYFAWIGETQKCQECGEWVVPKELIRLDEGNLGNIKIRKLHDQQACSRCIKYQKRCFDI